MCPYVDPLDCTTSSLLPGNQSVAALMYFAQIAIEQRFQEPQTLEKWAAGERITPLVDLGNIDRVPVSIVMPISDQACSTEMTEMVYTQLGTKEKYIRWEHGTHLQFIGRQDPIFGLPIFRQSDTYMTRLVETIEYGTVQAAFVLHTSLGMVASMTIGAILF